MTEGVGADAAAWAETPVRAGEPASADSLFAGPGEMRARCRAVDWSATPLGPSQAWPVALRTGVRMMLASPVATSLWCGPGYTLIYNDTYQRILGVKHPRALGRSGAEVWDELWPELEPQFAAIGARGDAVYADEALLRMERLEGGGADPAWFTYALSPLADEDGTCVAVYNVAVEITEKVRARQGHSELAAQLQDQQVELELSNQQLQDTAAELEVQAEELQNQAALLEERREESEAARRAAEHERARAAGILEAMADAHFVLDAEFRLVAVNAAMERSVGQARGELLGRVMWDAFPGTAGTVFERHYRAAASEGAEAHFTHDYRDDRLDLVTEVDIYPGPAGGVAVFWRDVTARERDRAALVQSNARYRTLFESIDEGFCVLEMILDDAGRAVDYRFVEANPAFGRLTGLVDAVGHTARELIPTLEEHWFETYGRVALTGQAVRFENRSEPMGRWFSVFAFRAGALEERKVALLFTDVTATQLAYHEHARLLEESERARGEAEAARAEAEAANRTKGEFLAVMSHELRTPLNAIGGYAELLELGIRGPVTPQQADDLRRIRLSQRHLLGLINEVLNYAKLETGSVHFDVADVPVADAVAAAELLVAPQALGKELTLVVGECPRTLVARADAEKLRQILVNLLSNAIKFTDGGGRIEIRCARVEGGVAVAVTDTGTGIPPEKMDAIFDPFVQVRADLTRPHEGTGLGLAISRDLARGMAGELTASSTPGVGSTFVLTLPAAD